MDERVMIFIDGSNLYHSLKNHFNRADLDLGKFTNKLLLKRQLVRIYYYNAMVGQKQEPEVYKQQQAFFAGVNAVPYTELRLGRLVYTNQWPHVPPYEKGTDVQLATDMITHSYKNNYDVAILVAGDNDFAGAVQAVKDNGKHVEIVLFGNPGTSQQLRDVADRVIPVNGRFIKDCWSRQPQARNLAHGTAQTQSQKLPPADEAAEEAPAAEKPPEAKAEAKPEPKAEPKAETKTEKTDKPKRRRRRPSRSRQKPAKGGEEQPSNSGIDYDKEQPAVNL